MIPGPLSLFMVENSIRHGIIKSWPAFLGGTIASSMYLVISAATTATMHCARALLVSEDIHLHMTLTQEKLT